MQKVASTPILEWVKLVGYLWYMHIFIYRDGVGKEGGWVNAQKAVACVWKVCLRGVWGSELKSAFLGAQLMVS